MADKWQKDTLKRLESSVSEIINDPICDKTSDTIIANIITNLNLTWLEQTGLGVVKATQAYKTEESRVKANLERLKNNGTFKSICANKSSDDRTNTLKIMIIDAILLESENPNIKLLTKLWKQTHPVASFGGKRKTRRRKYKKIFRMV
jgi:hypothetical protein